MRPKTKCFQQRKNQIGRDKKEIFVKLVKKPYFPSRMSTNKAIFILYFHSIWFRISSSMNVWVSVTSV